MPGQDGVAVFPPSAVSVFLNEEHGSPRNSFPVTITELEPHGDQIRVHAGGLSADITPAASADLGLDTRDDRLLRHQGHRRRHLPGVGLAAGSAQSTG